MTTAPTATPPAVVARQRREAYEAITAAARTLDITPSTVAFATGESGERQASMIFDTVNQAAAWADHLHWPYAVTGRAGRFLLFAGGQWLGFSWEITATEPLTPVPAPAHREG